jgi:GntR family transcriptional regulator
MGKCPTIFAKSGKSMTIQRSVPIVDQVVVALRQRIHEGIYPPGGRIPSENQLAQELKVSRTTIRTALTKFASEGLITRIQGDGTYINKRIGEVAAQYGGLRDFSSLIEASGFQSAIQTLSLEERTATPEESQRLEIEPDAEVISIVRLFSADNRPVIHATNIFPKKFMQCELRQLDGKLPLNELLQSCYSEQVAYIISDIEAAITAGELANILHLEENRPILKLCEVFFSKEHQPLFMGCSYYDFTIVRLRLVRAWI